MLAVTAKVGVARSHQVSIYEHRPYPHLGVTAGAGIRLRLFAGFGIQAEALYTEKGDGGLHLGYWEFPVTGRFEYPRRPFGFTAAVAAGVAPARLVRCAFWTGPGQLQTTGASAAAGYRSSCRMMITKSDDIGVVASLEVQRTFGPGRIGAELRYTRGWSNLVSDYACCNVQNRSVALIVGYELGILR